MWIENKPLESLYGGIIPLIGSLSNEDVDAEDDA